MSQVLNMKLTESANICYISDRVSCTIKQNIKENFLENNGLARICEGRFIPATLGLFHPRTHVKQD